MGHLESVDNALRLLLIVARGGPVSVTLVAAELGVAPSTAHRLLNTMRYRGFVEQSGDRTYGPGPAISMLHTRRSTSVHLMRLARPHLDHLARATGETCHLTVLIHREVRFLASAESHQALRDTSRVGQVKPAHLTSGGKCLLADLPAERFDTLYPVPAAAAAPEAPHTPGAEDVLRLRRELAVVRQRGYAVNRPLADRGVFAVGVPVRDENAQAVAALSVSLPSVRFSPHRLPELVERLREAASAMDEQLAS